MMIILTCVLYLFREESQLSDHLAIKAKIKIYGNGKKHKTDLLP